MLRASHRLIPRPAARPSPRRMPAFVPLPTTFMAASTTPPSSPSPPRSPPRSGTPSPLRSPPRSSHTSPRSPPTSSARDPPTLPSATPSLAQQYTPPSTRRVPIYYTPDFKKHRPPPNTPHAECPARLDACLAALNASPAVSALLDWRTPLPVTGPDNAARRDAVLAAIKDVHVFPAYFQELHRLTKRGGGALDPDTYVSPHTYDVAIRAAGAWIEAVDAVLAEPSKLAWALARPPGHHASPASGSGFCIFSNAAIAAKYALTHEHVSSVAILDYDVHHGNGTQACVKDEQHIRFASSHEWPLYPHSGEEGVTGRFDNVLNINLPQGTALDVYKDRFENEMLPFLLQSDAGMPDLVIVSAGFDALDADPLASLEFTPTDYRVFTEILLKAVGKDTKLVFGLEGGYDLGDEGVGAAVRESIAGYCLQDDAVAELEQGDQVA